MTLSPAPYQMDAFSDSDITSLFEDLSSPYLHSETQQLEFKMEDLADSFLDQPETSVDFLEDLTLSLQEKSPVEDVTKDDPDQSPTRRSARIAEKRRSLLQEIRPDDDPWLSTIDPGFFSTTENALTVPMTKKQRSSQSEYEMTVDEMEQMIWTLVWSQDQIYPDKHSGLP